MECKFFTKEESDFIITSDNDETTIDDSIVTSDGDAIKEEIDSIVTSDVEEATKEAKFDVVSLSFLEKDDSFLTPWSWNPNNAFNNENASTKEKKYLSFHPESYFTYQINYQKIQNENAQGNYKLYSRSCSKDLYPAPVILVITKVAIYLPVSYYYKNRKYYKSKKHGYAIVKDPEFIQE